MRRIAIVTALVLLGAGAARAEDGATLFKQKCSVCHGPDGRGTTKMGQAMKVRDLTALKTGEAEIQKIVTDGKPGTKMQGYKDKLSEADIKALAGYVKGLQK